MHRGQSPKCLPRPRRPAASGPHSPLGEPHPPGLHSSLLPMLPKFACLWFSQHRKLLPHSGPLHLRFPLLEPYFPLTSHPLSPLWLTPSSPSSLSFSVTCREARDPGPTITLDINGSLRPTYHILRVGVPARNPARGGQYTWTCPILRAPQTRRKVAGSR